MLRLTWNFTSTQELEISAQNVKSLGERLFPNMPLQGSHIPHDFFPHKDKEPKGCQMLGRDKNWISIKWVGGANHLKWGTTLKFNLGIFNGNGRLLI
jgi:hypothetical protein